MVDVSFRSHDSSSRRRRRRSRLASSSISCSSQCSCQELPPHVPQHQSCSSEPRCILRVSRVVNMLSAESRLSHLLLLCCFEPEEEAPAPSGPEWPRPSQIDLLDLVLLAHLICSSSLFFTSWRGKCRRGVCGSVVSERVRHIRLSPEHSRSSLGTI